ncbi:MAG: nucleoside recognition domain-containing protein, partial [Thermodesulfobacteriota bacterium]|nr:nucleoside recognition domain-containing protein [Thermodesulfobacteriota bacterium]
DIPVIVALNMWDDTTHRGVTIDYEKLEQILEVPVVPTVAITGEGVKRLVSRIQEATSPQISERNHDERWAAVGRVVEQVQTISHRHHTWLEHLADASIKPFSGLFIAFAVLSVSFLAIRFIGEGLIGYIFEPFFNAFWAPLMMRLSIFLGSEGFLHNIIIGKLVEGKIDFIQSFGLFTTGLFIPIGAVFPYIFSFYFILGFLEDFGYLPRLAVLLDNLMHRIGVHGYAIIPVLLGLGCNVPGILATRILESKKERFIVATLISIGVPCAALQAMIFGLVGDYGGRYVILVYALLFIVWVILGAILNLMIKGFSPELLIEIPPYRFPPIMTLVTKLWARILGFLKEALPIVFLGIFIVTVLYALKIFDFVASFTAPIVSTLLGLPKEAIAALVIGFLRKDMAVGMLGILNLSAKQVVIGTIVLAMFFPCIATFAVITKELGIKDMLKASGIMVVTSLTVGGLLNLFM